MLSNIGYLYKLVDPRNPLLTRYIGKTKYPKDRISHHIGSYTDYPKDRWIKKLRREGIEPKMVILASVDDNDVDELEILMISTERDHNKKLMNIANGGEGSNGNSKKVYQFNFDGKLISSFDSLSQAARKYNIKSSSICSSIKNKYSSAGYFWSYINILPNGYKYSNHNSKVVYQFSIDGKLLNKYNSATEAARICLGTNRNSSISRATKTKSASHGYYWSFENYLSNGYSEYKLKKVYKFDLKGNFIQSFDSMQYANKSIGSRLRCPGIGSAIRRGGIAKGFRWSYKKEIKFNNKKTKK